MATNKPPTSPFCQIPLNQNPLQSDSGQRTPLRMPVSRKAPLFVKLAVDNGHLFFVDISPEQGAVWTHGLGGRT